MIWILVCLLFLSFKLDQMWGT